MKKFNLLFIALLAWAGSVCAQSNVIAYNGYFSYDSTANGGNLTYRAAVASMLNTTATFPSGSTVVRFVISTDSIIDTTDILIQNFVRTTDTTFLPGANQIYSDSISNINTNPAYPKGVNLWVGAIVDPHNVITETDETNNATKCQRTPGAITYTFMLPISTGLQNLEVSNTKLYPNPSYSPITLETEKDMSGEIAYIYNSIGQQVAQHQLQGTINQLNIEQLPQGVYTIQLLQNIHRFVKQ